MNLTQLIGIQKANALVTSDIQPDGSFVIGGQMLTPDLCMSLLEAIGWEPGRIGYKAVDAVNRTNVWATAFRKNITNQNVLDCNVSFSAIRKADSEKFIERVHITGDGIDLTVVKGGGVGAFAVYEPKISQSQPQDTYSSIKGVCEYLNDLI